MLLELFFLRFEDLCGRWRDKRNRRCHINVIMTSEEDPWKMRLTWPGPQPTLQLLEVWWLPHNSCQSSQITPEGPFASFLQSVLFSSAHYSGHATLPSTSFHYFKSLISFKKNYSRYMRLLGWVTSASCHISLPPLCWIIVSSGYGALTLVWETDAG